MVRNSRSVRYDTTPFDRYRVPPNQNIWFMPGIWLLCRLMTVGMHLKVRKVHMKGLKPPFLVLGTHHAFLDFVVTPLALFPHRANYVSELEGFENYGEWLYRQVGCLGTRKFVNDVALIRNIRNVMARKGILVLYPEARYANVGTSSELPASVGKLAKYLDVPIVTLQMQGNYLQSPIWNLKKRRGVVLRAEITQQFTQQQLRETPVEEVQRRLEGALTYDEYAYQWQQKIAIDVPWRAEGLEMPLYQCPGCRAEMQMQTQGAAIFCTVCGRKRIMTKYGRLVNEQGKEDAFSHIPDWYEWQRVQVKQMIDAGQYCLDVSVEIESLPNAKNFIPLGRGRLVHTAEGFSLTFRDYGETNEKTLLFPSLTMTSVHTEYDYRGKGQCITLSTVDNTYFLYPLEAGFQATKIQFATEYFYKRQKAAIGSQKTS